MAGSLQTSIGQVVKAWREARQLSLAELAALAGPPITAPYISQLETGKISHPADKRLALLARALGIPDSYFLTRQLPEPEERYGVRVGQRDHPVSPDVYNAIVQRREAQYLWQEIRELVEGISASSNLSPESLLLAGGLIKESLQWLKEQKDKS